MKTSSRRTPLTTCLVVTAFVVALALAGLLRQNLPTIGDSSALAAASPVVATPVVATPIGATPVGATPIAATPIALPFVSGGLGLPLQEFERRYGEGTDGERGRTFETANGQIVVMAEDGQRVDRIERRFLKKASPSAARTFAMRVVPKDAELVATSVTETGVTVDLYKSASLAEVFPEASRWPGGQPGNFTVSYGDYDPNKGVNLVTTFVIALGNNQ